MSYAQRFLLGLVLILGSFFILWWGSPMRTGAGSPELVFGLAFTFVFALGFIVSSTAALGMKADYPGFLSGLVLYFILGALVCVFIYVTGTQVGFISLEDAARPEFWLYWVRVAATWPLELVQRAELMDYQLMRWGEV